MDRSPRPTLVTRFRSGKRAGTGPWRDRYTGIVITPEETMGRGILLWLLGVPIPIIIILALIWH